jgi:hypothetical protein
MAIIITTANMFIEVTYVMVTTVTFLPHVPWLLILPLTSWLPWSPVRTWLMLLLLLLWLPWSL